MGLFLKPLLSAIQFLAILFLSNNNNSRKDKLMQLIDQINEEQGRDTISLGAQGIDWRWQMRAELKSLCYTNCSKELAQVKS